MPVTGNEETGVKPMTRQSSDYIAGVPIKKRRFPLFNPPSPASDEPSSIQPENDAEQKEQSSPSQGSAISNACVATTSSGLSDANKKPISDVTNVTAVQNNLNYPRVKLEEQGLTIHSACQITLGKTELQLAPNEEALALSVGKEMCSKEKVEGKRKAEIPTVSQSTELSLGIKEHLVPALAGENSNGSGQNQDSLEPVYLNLSLSKGNGSTQCKSDDVKLNNSEQRCANRANWDLNTTMDAWEGSVSDAAAGKISADRFNTTDGTHDIKPLICSTGMIGAVVTSEKKSLVESEYRANLTMSSELSCQQYKSDDSLRLGLSPSFHQLKVSPDPSRLSVKVDSRMVVPNISFSGLVMPTGNTNIVNCRIVKSEPIDDSNKLNCKGAKSNGMRLLENRTVKRELVEQYQPLKSSNISTLKSVDPTSIKAEPVLEGNQETLKTIEGTPLEVGKQVLQGLSNPSCAMALPGTLQMSCPTGEPSCSTELTIARDVTNLLEQQSSYAKDAHLNRGEVPREACESGLQVASEKVAISEGNDGEEPIASGMTDIVRAEDGNADDSGRGRLIFMREQPSDLRGSGEGSVSDEEKINISADMLEDSYGSDYESDGNHPMDTERDGGEDDYEDGEVREPLLHTTMEEPECEKKELVHGDSDNKKDFVGQLGDDHPTSSHVEEKDAKTEDPSETNNKDMKDLHTVKGISVNSADEVMFLQESLAGEKLTRGAVMKTPITAIQIKSLDRSGGEDFLKQEIELSSEQTTKVGEGAVTTVTQGTEENVKQIDFVQENDMALTNTDASANGDDAAKDANSGGNRSRIINLSRAANASSPGKTRYFPGSRYLPSGVGRERLPDVALEGDKLHPRGRDEIYIDGPHKFSRERHQYQLPRNSRVNSFRGRGRTTRINGDWNDRDFHPEFYNGPTGFRAPRHKYAFADADNDLEYNSYNIAPDNAFMGTGRGGRKHFNDEGANFRHIPSRRRSPGGRDGPAARGGIQMIRRVPRNVSPSRCIGEDGSELVALRHTEKFMRVFPDDNIDATFTRPQPPYEGGDGHFPRGNRNFPTVQRRNIPQNRSKSPIRSGSRSPGPWSSPRRRSQDGFGGHPELTHRRSPPLFRMRSPDRPCFTDLLVRRHGSPSFLSRPSNDLRDIDSGRDHGHPRSVVPNRSPSGRILLRNRRFDTIDLRERTDNDEYFGLPMHTGRLHELGNDANGEERRRFGERRGPVRSFRPPYNGGNSENFHLNSEDGPRPFRFCPEDDSEFQERGNLRDREFVDRRINKNRPGNAPRRTRSIEEQEANYRHGGQEWHDEGFDEISRVKRKRF